MKTLKVPIKCTISNKSIKLLDIKSIHTNQLYKAFFRKRKLLLVEDNPLNREIARTLLTEEGFVIDEVTNGQEAIDRISQSTEGEYALILMDIQMPIMDGYETAKAIRNMKNPLHARIPIIAMTANAFDEEKKRALSCGMNGHISKPIDIDVLFNTIEGIIK